MDLALPHVYDVLENPGLEHLKYINFLNLMKDRRKLRKLASSKPIDATIDFTTTCHLKCPYCSTGNGTLDRPTSNMSKDQYARIISDLGDYLFFAWYFSTGEPLLNKQFSEIIGASKNMDIFSGISTNFSIPLSDIRIRELINSGLSIIAVSLDGATEETYEKYRVNGNFQLVLKNVQRFLEIRNNLGLTKPLLEWRFLRFRHNQHEEEQARKMAKDIGVDIIEFFDGYAPSNAAENEVQSTNTPLRGIACAGPALDRAFQSSRGLLDDYLKQNQINGSLSPIINKVSKCDWLYLATMIYPDGAVGPCCVATDRQDDFSRLNENVSLAEIWNTERYQRARNYFLTGEKSETICDRCPLPSSRDYQFVSKIRAILRAAPNWVLAIIASNPEDFFFEIDSFLSEEVRVLYNGELKGKYERILSLS